MGRLNRALDQALQFVPERVAIDLVACREGEVLQCLLGVVALAEEAPVIPAADAGVTG